MATEDEKYPGYSDFPGLTWKRPDGPPHIWRIVDGRKKMPSGEIPRFFIQEVPKELEDDVVEFMMKQWAKDEPINADISLDSDPLALHETRLFSRIMVRQGVSVVALKVNSDPTAEPVIVGANILSVRVAEDGVNIPNLVKQFKSRSFIDSWRALSKVSAEANVLKKYGIDRYLSSSGLSVSLSFRGQGLGEKILRARDDIGLAYQIPVSATAFTATVSQILAARVGYEVLFERKYSELLDDEGNVAFPRVTDEFIKVMGKRLY